MAVVAAFVPLARRGRRIQCCRPRMPHARHRLCRAGQPHVSTPRLGATGDDRLAWLSVGTTLAMVGLDHDPDRAAEPVPRTADRSSQSADANAARYLIWHGALIASAVLALAGIAPTMRNLLLFGGLGALLLAWAAVASSPLGDLASSGGFSPTMRALVALIVIAHAAVAAVWWRRAGGAVSWGDMCVLALMCLFRAGRFRGSSSSKLCAGSWWAQPRAALRPARDPRGGAVDRLHRRRRETARVRGRAQREPDGRTQSRPAPTRSASTLDTGAPRARPRPAAADDRRLRASTSLRVQPIVDLASRPRGGCRGVGALHGTPTAGRCPPSAASSTRTRSTWASTLELAVIRLALRLRTRSGCRRAITSR